MFKSKKTKYFFSRYTDESKTFMLYLQNKACIIVKNQTDLVNLGNYYHKIRAIVTGGKEVISNKEL